ncbi:MAG: hypothetical protein H0U16_06290 [Actinobacteria bacterium]|nr:hypothetical protein [Actinomycetota bacterium]
MAFDLEGRVLIFDRDDDDPQILSLRRNCAEAILKIGDANWRDAQHESEGVVRPFVLVTLPCRRVLLVEHPMTLEYLDLEL